MAAKRCDGCRYFMASKTEPEKGECRRHAPRPKWLDTRLDEYADPYEEERHTTEAAGYTLWPTVYDGNWCGEHAPVIHP